uniref:Uncharacterized protein n=1 Tax=Trypanosoma congolense (strain IL3000) TaxID=1068625 RepID=G0UIR3_TRYCI|nr:conserved hypothetical protein [Trypanosoma congolense IL3000]
MYLQRSVEGSGITERLAAGPFSFNEYLKEGTPYEKIRFPDAFETPRGCWPVHAGNISRGNERNDASRPERSSPVGSVSLPLPLPPTSQGRPATKVSRERLSELIEKRKCLQERAGQMLVQAGQIFPGNERVLLDEPTAHRRQREDTWNTMCARRLLKNLPKLVQQADRRKQCLNMLHHQKERRRELEQRSGSTLRTPGGTHWGRRLGRMATSPTVGADGSPSAFGDTRARDVYAHTIAVASALLT